MKKCILGFFMALGILSCSKSDDPAPAPTPTPVATDVIKIYDKVTSNEIANGAVVQYTGRDEIRDEANTVLKFYIKNLTSSPIKVRGKIVSITGTPNGTLGSFCIGVGCYNPLVAGDSYPKVTDTAAEIPANGTAGQDGSYKFFNNAAPATTGGSVDYVIEFYQYDNSNNVVGKTVKITYRHKP